VPLCPPASCSNAYNMVVNKYGERLYRGLVDTEMDHLVKVTAASAQLAAGPLVTCSSAAWAYSASVHTALAAEQPCGGGHGRG
jgi:hypothetical protein